jgi:homeobox-leucine zipper protein
MFTFANKAGLDMLETSLVALQDLTLDKIFDESGRKALFSDISKLMEQVRTAAAVHPGIKSSFTSIS